MDRISNLPLGIIETILCHLPIQAAASTSILSKEWRHHWTKITKISFIKDTFQVSTDVAVLEQQLKKAALRSKTLCGVDKVLFTHNGPIHEFILSVDDSDDSCVEIHQIMCHLSRKYAVKKLTLGVKGESKFLPLYIYSLHRLTDLYLVGCHLCWQLLDKPTFTGFRSLTSLSIQKCLFSEETILLILSNSPLLENLSIDFRIQFSCFAGEVPQELPTKLIHLKCLFLEETFFFEKNSICRTGSLPIVGLLMRSSPNLEKLKIQFIDYSPVSYPFTLKDDYMNIWLEHLNELEIINMIYEETVLDFVKLILTKSPVLKKARIFLRDDVDKYEELEISRILFCSGPASPLVDITIHRKCKELLNQ